MQAQREAEAAILAAAPRYAQAAEKPVPAADFQRLLAADEALAFLFIADTGGYGFFVRPNGLTAYRIPLSSTQVTELVTQLRNTTVAQPGGLPTPDFAVSYRLYAALFGPVEQQFAGVRKISVSATGDLLRYPLEALVTQPGATDNNGDFRQVPFLVRRVALAYVPAPRVLANIRSSRAASSPRPFIGFGDFRPPSAGQLLASFPPDRCGNDYRYLQGLQPLPATRTQVLTVGQQLGAGPGDIVVGDEFTRQRLERSDLSQYRNILLATHAFFPGGTLRCMTEPATVLSPPPGAPTADAAYLHPRTIERLKLNADLVALSACNTSGAQGGESSGGTGPVVFPRRLARPVADPLGRRHRSLGAADDRNLRRRRRHVELRAGLAGRQASADRQRRQHGRAAGRNFASELLGSVRPVRRRCARRTGHIGPTRPGVARKNRHRTRGDCYCPGGKRSRSVDRTDRRLE